MAAAVAVGLSAMDCARRHFFPHRFRPPQCITGTSSKTEPSCCPLSFLPNSKTSRALNHWQSNLQEAPVCQPCPPAMKISRGIILVGPQLLIFWSKNRELLEIDSFLPSHIYLGSWQTINFGKKIFGTVGDALTLRSAGNNSARE